MANVAVLIPTYNREEFLGQAIDSILSQTHKNITVVVYDDGSTDNTKELLKKYDVTVLGEDKNRGVNYARNQLIDYARASEFDYFVWQDSDDISEPKRVEVLVEAIKRKKVDMLFSAMYFFKHPNKNRRMLSRLDISKYTSRGGLSGNINFPTAIFTKKPCKYSFDSSITGPGGDVVWLTKLIKNNIKFGYIDTPLYYLRRHKGRITQLRYK